MGNTFIVSSLSSIFGKAGTRSPTVTSCLHTQPRDAAIAAVTATLRKFRNSNHVAKMVQYLLTHNRMTGLTRRNPRQRYSCVSWRREWHVMRGEWLCRSELVVSAVLTMKTGNIQMMSMHSPTMMCPVQRSDEWSDTVRAMVCIVSWCDKLHVKYSYVCGVQLKINHHRRHVLVLLVPIENDLDRNYKVHWASKGATHVSDGLCLSMINSLLLRRLCAPLPPGWT